MNLTPFASWEEWSWWWRKKILLSKRRLDKDSARIPGDWIEDIQNQTDCFWQTWNPEWCVDVFPRVSARSSSGGNAVCHVRVQAASTAVRWDIWIAFFSTKEEKECQSFFWRKISFCPVLFLSHVIFTLLCMFSSVQNTRVSVHPVQGCPSRLHVDLAHYQHRGSTRSRDQQWTEFIRLPHHLDLHSAQPASVCQPLWCHLHDLEGSCIGLPSEIVHSCKMVQLKTLKLELWDYIEVKTARPKFMIFWVRLHIILSQRLFKAI